MDTTPVFNRAVHGIDRAILTLAAIMLVVMMLHISLDVLANLLLNSPIPLTSAFVTQYYMIAVAFLPLAAGEYRGAHISVDLFVNRLAAAPRRWLDLAVLALCLAVYLMLASQSWQQATEKFASNSFILEQTTRLSIWPSYFVLPVAFGLTALLIALKVLCRLLGRPEPEAPVETNEEKLLERYGDV